MQGGFYRYFCLILIFVSQTINGSEWNIKCRFNEQNNNVFWTGEEISGFVEFINKDNSDLKFERIDADLIGEIVSQIPRTVNTTEEKTISNDIFLNDKILVHPLDKKGHFSIPYGIQSWPFSFQLNKHLPPSFDKDNNEIPKIRYFTRFSFIRSEWYKSNIHKIFPIFIKQSARLLSTNRILKEKTSRKGVRLLVTLEKNVVVAGNHLAFNVDLTNPKGALMRRVSIIFTQYVESKSNRKKEFKLTRQDLDKIKNLKDKHFNHTFYLPILSTIPATFSFHHEEHAVKVHYGLYFEVHLRGFFTSIHFEVPIVITNEMSQKDEGDD